MSEEKRRGLFARKRGRKEAYKHLNNTNIYIWESRTQETKKDGTTGK